MKSGTHALNDDLSMPAPSGGTPLDRSWTNARRQFLGNRIAVLALILLSMLFGLAVFAPFLAGNKPLVLHDGYKLSFPLFESFTAEDFLWLAGFFIFVLTALLNAILRRRYEKKGIERGTGRTAFFFVLLLSITAVSIGISWPERIDHSDYTALREGSAKAEFCIMPPIPWSPQECALSHQVEPPSTRHWFGTDPYGRDLAARVIHGARVSMLVGFVAVLFYVLIGGMVGSAAGYFGGITDLVLSRVIEAVLCFPVLFTILAALCFLPPSVMWIMLLIGLFRWPKMARLVRGEFLRLKNEEFVVAARAMGLSHFRVILRIFPNSLGPVFVAATFGVAEAILIESGLSFLGFGVQPPTPSWGEMLASGKGYIERAWWLTLYPGFAIFLAITSFNLVGEGLRDALDPRMRR